MRVGFLYFRSTLLPPHALCGAAHGTLSIFEDRPGGWRPVFSLPFCAPTGLALFDLVRWGCLLPFPFDVGRDGAQVLVLTDCGVGAVLSVGIEDAAGRGAAFCPRPDAPDGHLVNVHVFANRATRRIVDSQPDAFAVVFERQILRDIAFVAEALAWTISIFGSAGVRPNRVVPVICSLGFGTRKTVCLSRRKTTGRERGA